jgi:energy-coupling factor transport system substrate-specific component
MKKIISGFVILTFIFLIIVLTFFNFGMDKILIVSAILLIVTFIIFFEIKAIDSKHMAAVSTLAAIGAASRVPFAVLPGLQPTTFIVCISGYVLGPVNGFMVGIMAPFISNFFLGQGPWTLWQMIGWGLCGVFFGLARFINKNMNIYFFAILCGIWGYIYGIIQDMWYVVAFIKPFNFKAVLTGVVASFYFDTLHSIGNIIFTLTFGKKFILILERFNKRNTVEYID